ncbi:tigger transposable element-derived protein 2-like [Anoplophora glabripennis]|uniref:tigger transposable element-derived protein 2-like n=1 Tax=Anoplophora glabripennis TaxID=217634 RepID=UPI0008752BF8|nr:tigger transposable element-derived protein 2-like [Anoplophora glabripennis]
MKPATKRKHKVLSIEDKVRIIKRLENGESGVSLARIYNIGKATISDIKAKKEEVLNFASILNNTGGSKGRKTMKKANCEKLEDALYLWFIQKREQDEYVSGPLLCKKALQLNKELAGPPEFKASSGWLKNFKCRHGIKFANQGERVAPNFLKEIMKEGSFSEDDVYQADQTNLYWKALPRKFLASRMGRGYNFTVSQQRIILMFCANVSGQHILPLLVIGKFETLKNLEGVTSPSLEYRAQKNADMDADIFLDWFRDSFIPNVKNRRLIEGRTNKVLLLIDDVPVRPLLEQLNAVDDNFIVKVLPSEDVSSLQPLRYDVLQELSTMYKSQFLQQLLDKDEDSIIEFLTKFSLTDCCYMLADAWTILSNGITPEQDLDKVLLETVTLFQKIPGFSECGQDDAMAWLYDHDILDEEEIVAAQYQEHAVVKREGSDSEEQEETGSGPTHVEAFTALETTLAWCKRQPEFSSSEILVLKKIRDVAAMKIQSS